MRSFVRFSTIVLLFIFILISGTAYYLLATERGFLTVLQLAQKNLPGELDWERYSGRLIDQGEIESLRYQQADGLLVEIEQIALSWEVKALLSRRLLIDAIEINKVSLVLPAPVEDVSKKDKPAIVLPNIHLPIAVAINRFHLQDVRWRTFNTEQTNRLDSAYFSASMNGNDLTLSSLEIAAEQMHFSSTVQLTTLTEYPLEGHFNWQIERPVIGELRGTGSVTGSLAALAIQHSTQGSVETVLNGELTDVLQAAAWNVNVAVNKLDIRHYLSSWEGGDLQARLSSQGRLDEYSLSAQLETSIPQAGDTQLVVSATGSPERIVINGSKLSLKNKPTELSAQGSVALADLMLDIKAQWRDFAWPLQSKKSIIKSSLGSVNVSGAFDQLVFDAQAALTYQADFSAKIQGELSGRQLDLTQIKQSVVQ